MNILHTSDWHLGNRLMEQSRQGEFAAFLDWLLATMAEQQVEALLICGDVFDSSTPSDSARELYCDFLSRADATGCRHIIITGGNHDSVQQLRVASPLLARHHAHVIPSLQVDNAADCLIPLHDAEGREAALVAAVPFLRVAEVARRVPADDAEARRRAYVDGVADVYAAVARAAADWKAASPLRAHLPCIAMGHLTLGGAQVTDSTRLVTIGRVEALPSSSLASIFDYVALGHLHQPSVHDGGRIRYCGSPLPMGFDEAALPHELQLLRVSPGGIEVTSLPVPRFALYEEATCATPAELAAMLSRLKEAAEAACATPLPVCLKLTYTGADKSLHELNTELAALAEEYHLRSFRCMRAASVLCPGEGDAGAAPPSLQDMEPHQLFARRLAEWEEGLESPPSAEERTLLSTLFSEVAAEARTSLYP